MFSNVITLRYSNVASWEIPHKCFFFTWKIIYKFKWFSIAMFDYQRVIAIWFNCDKHGDINEWAPYPATTIQTNMENLQIPPCKLSKHVGTTGFSTSMTNLWHGDIKEEYGWRWGSWQLIRINKVCQGITNKLGIFSRDISSNIEIQWDNLRGFTRQIRVGTRWISIVIDLYHIWIYWR